MMLETIQYRQDGEAVEPTAVTRNWRHCTRQDFESVEGARYWDEYESNGKNATLVCFTEKSDQLKLFRN